MLMRCPAPGCTLGTIQVSMPDVRRCPRCGGVLQEVGDPPAEPAVLADNTLIAWETYRAYMMEATTISMSHIRAGNERKTKPYVDALSHALTLIALCAQFKWDPHEMIETLAGIQDRLRSLRPTTTEPPP